jgi:hypothetical protein
MRLCAPKNDRQNALIHFVSQHLKASPHETLLPKADENHALLPKEAAKEAIFVSLRKTTD